jgi:acetyltransferase-like isoleucine patch superfamily enzyme
MFGASKRRQKACVGVFMKRGKNCKVYRGAVLFPNVVLGDNVTIFPGAVIGRPPLSTGATRLGVTWDSLPIVKIGNNCVIGANAVIYADVEIGDNSMVCDTACIREQCRIGSFCVIAQGVTINYNTKIGNHVRVMDNSHLTGNMVIEDKVFIGMLVTTANDNFMGRQKESYQPRGPIIRKFATIGQGSCILPEVEIGENAIIGSNAVVTKDVAPRTVVMGTPARFVRDVKPEEIVSE